LSHLNERTPQRLQPPAGMTSHNGRRSLLDRTLPHIFITPDNPVFAYELRRLPKDRTVAELKRFTRRRLGWMIGAGAALWGILVLAMILSDDAASLYSALWQIVLFLLVISALDRFVLDFSAATGMLDNIRRDIDDQRWHLIQLTDISSKVVIRAKYAAAQIRAWRLLITVIGLRLLTGVMALLTILVIPLLSPLLTFPPYRMTYLDPYAATAAAFRASAAEAFTALTIWVALAIALAVYIYEPRWRLRALTAASLAISARLRDPALALFSAVGSVLGLWVLQGTLAFIALLVFNVMIALIITSFERAGSEALAFVLGGLFLVVYSLLSGVAIFTLYNGLASHWLDRAYRRLRQLGGAG
jgi:hypothetical protein